MTAKDDRLVSARPAWLTALGGATLLLGLVHAGFLVFAIVQRFRFPVELEWMSGAVFDHVERVQNGQPIYGPPSVAFIPFMYPPLYYWLAALVAKALPIPAACRVVSILACGTTAVLVFRATRLLGATRYWSLVATCLYLGAYSITGYWYDLERSDTLLVALLAGGLVVLLASRGVAGAAVAGALVGGAVLAKQPALVFFVATAAGLFIVARPRAFAFAAGGLAVLGPLFGWLVASTGGWFWFYCFAMPARHGIDLGLLSLLLVVDGMKIFGLLAATAATLGVLGARLVRRLRRDGTDTPLDEKTTVFGFMLAAAFFTSATSRLHVGGYVNVLMFWTTFGAIAFGAGACRLAAGGSLAVRGLVHGAALLQLAHLLYDPGEAAPTAKRLRADGVVADRIHALEKRGEVIVTGRGHVTTPRHFHLMALGDVMRNGPMPEELVRGLEERRYAGYVVDEFGELGLEAIAGHRTELFEHVVRNYFVAERLDDREPAPLVGWWAHPSWILLPRRAPLTGFSAEQLDRRRTIEAGIAEMRMRAVQAGAGAADFGDDVEREAAAVDRGER